VSCCIEHGNIPNLKVRFSAYNLDVAGTSEVFSLHKVTV